MSAATSSLKHGTQYPYDNRQPDSAAHRAALGVLANLLDRRGIRQALEDIDGDIRTEIVDELIEIIKEAGLTST